MLQTLFATFHKKTQNISGNTLLRSALPFSVFFCTFFYSFPRNCLGGPKVVKWLQDDVQNIGLNPNPLTPVQSKHTSPISIKIANVHGNVSLLPLAPPLHPPCTPPAPRTPRSPKRRHKTGKNTKGAKGGPKSENKRPEPKSDCAGVLQTLFATFHKKLKISTEMLSSGLPFSVFVYIFSILFPETVWEAPKL